MILPLLYSRYIFGFSPDGIRYGLDFGFSIGAYVKEL